MSEENNHILVAFKDAELDKLKQRLKEQNLTIGRESILIAVWKNEQGIYTWKIPEGEIK